MFHYDYIRNDCVMSGFCTRSIAAARPPSDLEAEHSPRAPTMATDTRKGATAEAWATSQRPVTDDDFSERVLQDGRPR